MVLTSHDQLGNTVSRPGSGSKNSQPAYFVFRDAGVQLTLAFTERRAAADRFFMNEERELGTPYLK